MLHVQSWIFKYKPKTIILICQISGAGTAYPSGAAEGNGSGNVDFYGRHYDFTDDLRHRWMTNDMLS
jgi:hypothetical protein